MPPEKIDTDYQTINKKIDIRRKLGRKNCGTTGEEYLMYALFTIHLKKKQAKPNAVPNLSVCLQKKQEKT